MRYPIPEQRISDEFGECWTAAARHIQRMERSASIELAWLKMDLRPPMLEHLSFRLGNQLFFVRVEDADLRVVGPSTLSGLLWIADGCRGHPCVMPMRLAGTEWQAVAPGWGLAHARTLEPIHPTALVTEDLIELTDWELQDFAVQIVAQMLERDGIEVTQKQGAPTVDPSIWFMGERGLEWVVVRAVRYPARDASRPANLADIAASCAKVGTRGHFASVGICGADEPYDGSPHTLWRGAGMYAAYDGLETVDEQ